MAPKTKRSKQNDGRQPPSGVNEQDWEKTPPAVRKYIKLTQISKGDARNYAPKLSVWVMSLLNLAIGGGLTIFLEKKITIQCVTPHQISAISMAFITLITFHIIWRNLYVLIPPNINESVHFGAIAIPLTIFVVILNELHPWKLPSRLLGFFLLVSLAIGGFLNLSSYSPFRPPDKPSIVESFSIQRFDKSPLEKIPTGGTLAIQANEKVLVEAIFKNQVETTCVWYSAMSSENHKTGCSIVLDEVSNTNRDALTILTQSACGTQSFSGLHVVVQP